MQILFIDESGDHNLTKIDPLYPVFVLGGAIIEKNYADNELIYEMDKFKQKVFGTTNIILHTAEICRNENKFLCLKDKDFRAFFYQELNDLMRKLQYKVVACVIHKDNHLNSYGSAALDPYILSLDILLERFGYELSRNGRGIVIAEKRNDVLDDQLKIAWENLKIQGTRHFRPTELRQRIYDFKLDCKKNNTAGLQLADLIVSPIGRYILGKQIKEDFQIIRQKFRKNDKGIYEGYGLVVLPK